ncbi:hypothetical protein GCM10023115_54970 [Pontixanthobacter gangjinensis]|uniref:Response regulator n=1 Tax=Pontixanthobacter gangjinensis TaxID=1028742 RepID=A0A6I4SS02_9SPHN|nr:response regulator transcription factor [Pontixanthobacter gangjinensis]MXO57776.1 response regulator [Pontixanthobacter gangjinensis]
MEIVNIFVTAHLGESLEDFQHDTVRFVFDRIGPEGPKRLVEGSVWAFIDWVMDDLSGLEMCRRMRADPRTADAHITIVLDNDDLDDRRRALKAGADDYITGPLGRTTVLDRVMALQSQQRRHAPHLFSQGNLVIDMTALKAMWRGTMIELRPNEFRLLRFFAENSNRMLSRQELIVGIGKQEPLVDDRTVDVWIGRLRRSLRAAGAGDPLRTIRTMGYVFDL